MSEQPTSTSLERFLTGIAENVFHVELGVVDPPMVDYVSTLMVRFLRLDSVFRVRSLNGRPLTQVTDMLLEANERVGDAQRAVHQHIGDFTLFWAGLYPEALRRMRGKDHKDHFIDYCEQGKRAYFIASQIESSRHQDAPAEVLERLSQKFEMCAYGLREIRREWERRDDDERSKPFLIN